MGNEVLSNEQTVLNNDSLTQLVERLKPVRSLLGKNTYIKDTTRRLNRLIEDASSKTIVLVMGKERVGKTTIINSILGGEILSTNHRFPTSVNTFIKYGEEPLIRAIFNDGMVATFDISKLELLTISDTFAAQIIREHLDYLEIYIKNDVLKNMTIVDSVALEMGGTNSAYLSEILLNRADEILWVVRSGTGISEPELHLLKKYNARGIQPHLIINATDELEQNKMEFIKAQKEIVSSYVASVIPLSAKKAIEAKKTNNTQLLIDSQLMDLQQLIQKLYSRKDKKMIHSVQQIISWLDNFITEIKLIPMREPFISAKLTIESLNGENGYESTREQRDKAIISAYRDEYEKVANVFKPVQTLYQLLQLLTKELYLRDAEVESFEGIALQYQQQVREYRKLHVEYMQAYGMLDQQTRKQFGKGIEQLSISKHPSSAISELVEKRTNLVKLFNSIKNYEEQVVSSLYQTQNHLCELAQKRLDSILKQAQEVHVQRKVEVLHVESYNKKVEEFQCVEDAQKFILDGVKPYLLSEDLPISDAQRRELTLQLEKLEKLKLEIQQLHVEIPSDNRQQDTTLTVSFDSEITLSTLSLTEADVISDIPALPKEIGKE